MDIIKAASTLLLGSGDLRPLVETRIFISRLPQTITGTSVVLWTISEIAHSGLKKSVGLDQALIQFNVYSATISEARAAGRAIWQSIDGYSGVVDSVYIQGVSRASGIRDQSNRPLAGSDSYQFVTSQDLLFSYCSKD